MRYSWNFQLSKYSKRNFQTVKSDYQMAKSKEYLLASGNITIWCASADRKCEFEIINISIDTSASIMIRTTGNNTFIDNATSIKLASRGDLICGFGDGRSHHIIDRLKRGVEISW